MVPLIESPPLRIPPLMVTLIGALIGVIGTLVEP